MSATGAMLKQGFNMLMHEHGQTILIYKNYGTPQQTIHEARGLKNSEERRPDKVLFQFGELQSVSRGDILQVKGSRDLWCVTDTEDEVEGGVLISFTVHVAKQDAPRREWPNHQPIHLNVNAPVYGTIQIQSPNSSQNVSISLNQVEVSLEKLKDLLSKSSINELDKEEALAAIDRINQLAHKPKTNDVIARAKEKLELVKNTIGTAVELSKITAPYIALIGEHFAK